MAPWRPKLPATEAPLYRRLADAMSADIAAGRLGPGARLPPQRELAHALSISVGAVTRAYEEAARRGLVAAHVGRGTFVIDRAGADEPQSGPIDLSINTAPIAPAELIGAVTAALRRPGLIARRLDYQPTPGLEVDRRAAAAWLTRTAGFDTLDWRNLITCPGAQGAMAIALAVLARVGDTILTELATFPGAKALAVAQGYRLHGVEMDREGLVPDALDRAAATTGARILYTLPTLQNPTARTMGRARRTDIARIARARDLLIVEDDPYAVYARGLGLPPLAALAPERTLYVSSLSKILAPGLRAGFLIAPPGDLFTRCLRAARALMHSPAGVSAAIASEWLESGRADELAREVRAETGARTKMALTALDGMVDTPQTDASLHLWLPLPAAEAERAAARALSAGVRLPSPGAFAVATSQAASGLRICLGSAPNRATLERALSIVKNAVSGEVEDPMHAAL